MKSWSKSKAPANMKAKALNKPTAGDCRLVAFPRGKVVWRCDNRKLRAHNKNQCRKGTGRSFKAHQFVPRKADGKCPRKA